MLHSCVDETKIFSRRSVNISHEGGVVFQWSFGFLYFSCFCHTSSFFDALRGASIDTLASLICLMSYFALYPVDFERRESANIPFLEESLPCDASHR